MNDILPADVGRWQRLEAIFRDYAERWGFQEIRTPHLEATELFVREIGENTDVVEKEMYSFSRHEEAMTLRPEGTAGAARAYVEHTVHTREPVTRWWYLGPMFRGERPAKGRYRQFWQAGCEIYGDPGPLCDAEMLDFLAALLRALGVSSFAAHLNTLGSQEARATYRERLFAFLDPKRASLSEDSQRRLDRNPLRILDSKDPRDQELVRGAPSAQDCLTQEDRAHWEGLLRHVQALGLDVVVDPTLVRGLDYYTRTLFELRATAVDLGAQSALLGGGRYDGMVASLGGPEVPAIGFAMGLERILTASSLEAAAARPLVSLLPLGERAQSELLVLARELRLLGVAVDLEGRGGSMKTLLRRANTHGARLAVIAGDNELDRRELAVKDLAAHTQALVPREGAAACIASLLARPSAPPEAVGS